MTTPSQDEWISAFDALKSLTGDPPSLTGAPPILARLRAGLLPAWAEHLTERTTDKWGKTTFRHEAEGLVPQWFWERCCDSEPSRIHFRTGNFSGPGFINGQPRWIELINVHFDRAAIASLGSIATIITASQSRPHISEQTTLAPNGGGEAEMPKDKGGAPRKEVEWEQFWRAVVQIAHNGRLTSAHFKRPKDLREEILTMISDALSDRTIKPVVDQLWATYVNPAKTQRPQIGL